MSAPSAPVNKLTQEQIQAIYALTYDHKGKPMWRDAEWIGACGNGHLIVGFAAMVGHLCDECTPGGEGGHHPYYVTLPQQDTLLAAYYLGGWEAVVTAAKELAR